MSNQRYDVITALDTCADLIVRGGDVVPRFGQAEQLVDGYFLEMGGSACIFACQCAKLGLRTTGVGKVGGDAFGELVLRRLVEAGVDTSNVPVDGGVQTGLGIALCREEGERAILTVTGSIGAAEPEALLKALPLARHLHVASYYLLCGLRAHWPAILREAKRLGLTTSLDTNWDPAEKWDGLDELAPYLDILLPNENELAAFTGIGDAENAAKALAKRVPLVVAKQGPAGAMAVRRGEEPVWCPAPATEAVDTVGAGDTFDGGFLYGHLNGWSLADSLRMGVFCGSKSVTQPGGYQGQPRLGDLNDLYAG